MRKIRKMAEMQARPLEADSDLVRSLSRERIMTYASVIFLPPYGLYRVWQKDSTFTRAERWVWSMIVISYIGYFLQMIF